jgi:uncharacterized damage-inducible protein DinB
MNADAFRQFYEYHFTENRALWDRYVTPLSDDVFTQRVDYSHGSVRDQILHLMSADDYWFSGLRGVQRPEPLEAADFADRNAIRVRWDSVEQSMRDHLARLTDDKLFERGFTDGEDPDVLQWQALLHVANHGTDHRSQLLRLLHDLGVETTSQDYIFYLYQHVL